MFKLFVLVSVISLGTCMPGGYSVVTSTADLAEYRAIFTDVQNQGGLTAFQANDVQEIQNIEMQVVAGRNLRYTLLTTDGRTCTVVIFDQPWTHTRQVTGQHCSAKRQLLAGGYYAQTNPEAIQKYSVMLAQAQASEQLSMDQYTIEKVETQVVSGLNIRYTLMINGATCHIVMYDQPWTHTRRITQNDCPTKARRQLLGGYSNVDVNDPDVQQCISMSLDRVNSMSNSMFRLVESNIMTAKRQIVAGTNYQVTFQTQQSTCMNAQEQMGKMAQDCPVAANSVMRPNTWKSKCFKDLTQAMSLSDVNMAKESEEPNTDIQLDNDLQLSLKPISSVNTGISIPENSVKGAVQDKIMKGKAYLTAHNYPEVNLLRKKRNSNFLIEKLNYLHGNSKDIDNIIEAGKEFLGGGDDHDILNHVQDLFGQDGHDMMNHVLGKDGDNVINHVTNILGNDKHDTIDHPGIVIGGDGHDLVPHSANLLGGDDHDMKPHGQTVMGGDDHDMKPHGQTILGGDDHDMKPHGQKILGGDDHDMKPHGQTILGGDDHDMKPHGQNMLGGDDHDMKPHGQTILGGDDHDMKPHGQTVLGGDDHDMKPHGQNILGGDDHDMKPHGQKILGGDDHDMKPHGQNMIGGDDHDMKPHGQTILGGDDHDMKPHGQNMIGGDDHDMKPHGQTILGGDDHDMKPHGQNMIGGDDHDMKPHGQTILGGDDHDMKPHGQKLLGGDDHDYCHMGMFLEFKAKFSKQYGSDKEEEKRFMIFCDNMRLVRKLQETEKGTAIYGATKFADLTKEEFKQYVGKRWDLNANLGMKRAAIPRGRAPDSFDWRDRGAVTPVKNQGSCGSCWAFSTTGNIEGQWAIKKKKLISLSEQELVDCDKVDEGCNGGLPSQAYKEIERLGGLETEKDYSYKGEDEKCMFNKTDVKVYINDSVSISSNETEMASWLATNGPISIGINAFAMQFYMGGISHPWKIFCNPKDLDHGVLIVGYGVQDDKPYWIVKNSWGPDWGEKGYYLVYRGGGVCGLNTMCTSAVVD